MKNGVSEEKIKVIESVGEEIVGKEELVKKMASGRTLVAYDGFEPSGRIHIAQGLLRAININKLTSQGIRFKMLVADWHSWANNKMGGDLDKIQTVGKYFIEVWKACGMDMSMVDFYWANDIVTDREYWKIVMNIAIKSTIKRIVRCGTILGRKESEMRQASQILAPLMQAADIFYLGADICQLGIDQRKVNMLAREVAGELGYEKPVIISHHLLIGLGKPPADLPDSPEERAIALKMSKSHPDSAVFMTDSQEEVEEKIKKAFCPPNQSQENPIMEYFRYIVFGKFTKVEIGREKRFGGNVTFESYDQLEKAYVAGEIFPLDLKNNLARYINEMLTPVRKHFEDNEEAKRLKGLVESFAVTR